MHSVRHVALTKTQSVSLKDIQSSERVEKRVKVGFTELVLLHNLVCYNTYLTFQQV